MMLETLDLRAGYGTAAVLHGLSLHVETGEIVAVVGRNGVGKTTLVKALMGAVPAMSGRVLLDGNDMTRHAPSHRVRHGLRATYQERGVFTEMSVADNLRLNGFQQDQFQDVLSSFADSLLGREAQSAGTLSGGEQKMFATAMALSSSAPLLVMDEPTEGLQPSNVDLLGSHLENARSVGRGVLLIEQHLALTTRIADRFILMEKGEIVDEGDASDPATYHRVSQRLAI